MKKITKKMVLILQNCFFLCLFSFNVHAVSSVERLTEQNYRTLSGRLWTIMKFRFEALTTCPIETERAISKRFAALPFYSNREEDVISALELYWSSLNVELSCRASLDHAELKFHESERQKFSLLHNSLNLICGPNSSLIHSSKKAHCVPDTMSLFRELDPYCMSVQVPNLRGRYDGFPCMAGDNLIGKFLYLNSDMGANEEVDFFVQRLQYSLKSKNQTSLELYDMFIDGRRDSLLERKKFLAVMALLTSSTFSSESYVEGYHDKSWRITLEKTHDARKALRAFNQVRLAVDEYRGLNELALKNKINLKVAQKDIKNMNRHDFMSAYLSCYFADKGSAIQKLIPQSLGYVYEGFDFFSHLREGDSFSGARSSFERDIRRYREGARWGAEFCQFSEAELNHSGNF